MKRLPLPDWVPTDYKRFFYPHESGDNTPPYLFHIANEETDVPSAMAFLDYVEECRETLWREMKAVSG